MRVLACAAALALVTSTSQAQSPSAEQLAAARALFADALHDQEASHFETALEKFERVQNVRDTAPIRYRIGTCQEALGRFRRAARAYQAAIALGGSSTADADVVRGARERLDRLGKKAARLAITLSGQTNSARVSADEEALEPAELAGEVWLDPGSHVITVAASDAVPSRTEIALPPGGRASLTIALEHSSSEPKTPSSAGRLVIQPPAKDAAGPQGTDSRRVLGYVTLGVGGALLLASAGTLFLRRGDIAELHRSCPDGHCPPNREAELTSTRERALALGPLGVTFGVVGLAAVGLGSVFLLTAKAAHVVPVVSNRSAGLALEGVVP